MVCVERSSGGSAVGTLNGALEVPSSVHQRFSQQLTAAAATVAYLQPRLDFELTAGAVDVTVRIYAPQLEQSAAPTSPILPTVGTPAAATRAADVVTGVTTDRASRGWYDTQWDYTDGGLVGDLLEFLPGVPRVGPKGLLVEEGSTNHIRNPRAEGAVAGAPGTLPTNWTFSMPGITHEVVGSGVANGKPYIDLKFAGTPTGDGFLYYESSTVVSAASGQTWTLAVDMSVVDGDLSNMDGIRIVLTERTSVGGNNGQNSSVEKLPDALPRRFYHTATLSNGTTAHVQPMMELEWTGSGNIDFTLRLSVPSLEHKTYPTSVVLPEAGSPAAATRALDSLHFDDGSWEKASSGFTLYAELMMLGSSDGAVVSLGPDNNNRLSIEANGFVFMNSGASTIFNSAYGGDTSGGTTVRVAAAMADADYALSRTGVTQQTAIGGPASQYGSGIDLHGAPGGGAPVVQGAFIRALRYFPTRLSNSELEALVA
jgi:hypothetical protein